MSYLTINPSESGRLLCMEEDPLRLVFDPAGGGEDPIADDFNRANGAIGGNWTVYAGGWNILDNEVVPTDQTPAFAKNVAIYTVDTGGINQWVRMKYTDTGQGGFLGPVFRFVDENSPHYECDFNSSQCYFSYSEDVAYSAVVGDNIINNNTFPAWPDLSTPQNVGVTLEGTGDGTVIRFWFGVTGEPDSVSLWGGNGPLITHVENPARSADVGTKVGICGFWQNLAPALDDFAAGAF